MDAKSLREKMKEKAHRLAHGDDYDGASDWKKPEPLDATVKTGARPISKRAFKAGGKVEGCEVEHHAGRAKRKAGGLVNELANTDVKSANEDRDGKKHVGGFAKGGDAKVKKSSGGPASDYDPSKDDRLSTAAVAATADRDADADVAATNAKYKKLGIDPESRAEAAGDETRRKKGGRVERKSGGRTNINIIVSPQGAKPAGPTGVEPPLDAGAPVLPHPPMAAAAPPPMAPPPPGLAGMMHPPMGQPPMPPGVPPAPPGAPPMFQRKSGGKVYPIKDGAGGAKGRLEKIASYGAK